MADRLIAVASTLKVLENNEAPFAEVQKYGLGIVHTLETLIKLIIAKKRNTLAAATSRTLTNILDTWSTRTPWDLRPDSNQGKEAALALSSFLNANSFGPLVQVYVKESRHSLKGRDVCALHSCQTGQGLKQCQRSIQCV